MTRTIAFSTTALAGLLALPVAFTTAQETEQRPQLAQQCLLELNTMAERMQEDQFWLSGWGGSYGAPAPQSTQAPVATSPVTGATTDNMTTGSTVSGTTDPRGQAQGIYSPRHQIRVLYSAARVLAHQGAGEGCSNVVNQLSNIYDGHIQRLKDAGVDPASVTTWRQEQVALAQPLSEAEALSTVRIGDLTGSDVHNLEDERLGTVSDVLIDPDSGDASYVLVARGGFLGIGEEHIAVPWDKLRATQGLELAVIDSTAAQLEQAPAVDPERFRNSATMNEDRQRTDQFWSSRG